MEDTPTSSPSEEELIAAAQKGDSEAFARLFHLSFPRFHDFVLRLVLNEPLAQQIVQEAYTGAWADCLIRAKPEAGFDLWLHATGYRLGLGALRRRDPRRHLTPTTTSLLGQIDPERVSDPQVAAFLNDQGQAFWAAAEMLAPEHRATVLLRLRQGYDFPRIGRVTGLSSKVAEAIFNKAVKELKSASQTSFMTSRGAERCPALSEALKGQRQAPLAQRRRLLDKHIQACPDCQTLLTQLEDPLDLAEALAPAALRPEVQDKILATVIQAGAARILAAPTKDKARHTALETPGEAPGLPRWQLLLFILLLAAVAAVYIALAYYLLGGS
jgi:RNA polymerase sigma-70 factor (ECF subfamily)